MEKSDWKRELARDFLAIGSWVFFVIIIARLAIGPYLPCIWQLLLAGIFLVIFLLIFKKADSYVARGVALAILASLFYNNLHFTVFVAVAFLGLCIAAWHLGSKCKNILFGLLLGLISIALGYYILI